MNATAYAIAAMVCWGIGDLVYKRGAAAGVPAHQFLMIQTWFFAPMVLLYGLLTRTLVVDPAAAWGAVAGLFAFSGFYHFARSLHAAPVSINAPIFRLSFVVTAVLAVIVLGEPLTARKVVGVGCALGAVWFLMISPPSRGHAPVWIPVGGLARVAIATGLVGVGNLLYKVGLQGGATAASLLVAQACVATSLGLALVRAREGRLRVPPGALRHAGRAGIVLALAFIFLMEGLARGQASIVVPIAQMGFVVSAALGILLLKEPFTGRKALGLGAALGALAFLAGG